MKRLLSLVILVCITLACCPDTTAANPVYFCENGSTLSIDPMLGLVFYNDKDHIYSYNYRTFSQDGFQVYQAKHGPVTIFQTGDKKTLYVKYDDSPNTVIYNLTTGTVNDNRHRLKTVNNALSKAIARTANANYNIEVAPYQNNGNYYNNNNNYNNNNRSTNTPTVQWVKCEFCGGDGISPIAKFTAGSEQKWCKKCNKMSTPHYHERCPNCKGEGRVQRLR